MQGGRRGGDSRRIDPFCRAATEFNRAANGVEFAFAGEDLVGIDRGWDVVLAGDVFYDRGMAERIAPWFSDLRQRGAEVLVGDPGRSYLRRDLLEPLAVYRVPVSRALEDSEIKQTTVWRFA